ncbi:transcription factor JunB [Achroia grisella]|uniref:transcription factor JunB n=1 Tax=Achroia grisella TaxID=688607 RepID=UPI0027D2A9BD|nr:transcription factor JunB [Achroia grisella]
MVRHSGHGMETTFYEDQYPLSGPVESLKRSLTLDLDFGRGGKRARVAAPVLSSPDLQLLKLGSPELEKMIIQNGIITTPTPNAAMFAAAPTEEQEMYARPFVEALDKLHHSDPTVVTPLGRRVYADLDRPLERYPTPVVKDEPQTVPSAASSPPLSPIDMDSQERIKLERKRQRNRVAASKCRRRKLERISKLEEKVKVLKGENAELAQMVVKLKDHVHRLKQQVLEHAHGGCNIDSHY